MTVSSVASLSLKPPSMMVGVNKEASINGVLDRNSNFCLNLLKKSGHPQKKFEKKIDFEKLYNERLN